MHRFLLLAVLGLGTLTSSLAAAEQGGNVELMPAAEVAKIRGLLPEVEEESLRKILHDASTMWYDPRSMPPAYQDSIPPFVGILETSRSGDVAPVEFFHQGHFRFPFGATGGAHRSPDVRRANFLALPERNGRRLPVVWWRDGNVYHWVFPNGTVVGEVLMRDVAGQEPVVFEIRARRRFSDRWHANAFRPFPTAESLAMAVTERRPNWRQDELLVKLLAHLHDPTTLEPRELRDEYGAFFTSGAIDVLPPINAELAQQLLRETTFRSAEGAVWKTDGELECYAPTTKSASIVPVDYDAGLIAVDEISCRRCHQETGRRIGDFVPSQRLYGQVWGSDQTFSWHPFEPSKLLASPNGLDSQPLRAEFIAQGVIERFEVAKHPSEDYTVLPETERLLTGRGK